jgi:hypothetical protein
MVEKYLKDLEADIEPKFIYETLKEKEKVWHKLQEIRFEGKEKELENYKESTTIEKDMIIDEDEYSIRTAWKKRVPTQEKPIIVSAKVEKIANEGMNFMYNFLKENIQGRIYRKPKDIEEFFEDICHYFRKGQTRRYDQDWEDRLYEVMIDVDPYTDIVEWTTKQRIRMFKKEGIDLKVYKRLTTNQAEKKKEEEFEEMIRKKTKKMNPYQAFMYRDRIMKEQYGEKKQPNLENEMTEKLINVHLKDEKDEIDQTCSLKWKRFKSLGNKNGIYEMKKKIRRWLGRERSDIREKIEKTRLQYVGKLKEHKSIIERIEEIEEENRKKGRFIPLLEEAMEKNDVMLKLNYKDHINKVLRNRMNN